MIEYWLMSIKKNEIVTILIVLSMCSVLPFLKIYCLNLLEEFKIKGKIFKEIWTIKFQFFVPKKINILGWELSGKLSAN